MDEVNVRHVEGFDAKPEDKSPESEDTTKTEQRKKRKRSRTLKMIIKIGVWCIIILVVLFLTLFLSSKIGEFDSIADMLRFIRNQF